MLLATVDVFFLNYLQVLTRLEVLCGERALAWFQSIFCLDRSMICAVLLSSPLSMVGSDLEQFWGYGWAHLVLRGLELDVGRLTLTGVLYVLVNISLAYLTSKSMIVLKLELATSL